MQYAEIISRSDMDLVVPHHLAAAVEAAFPEHQLRLDIKADDESIMPPSTTAMFKFSGPVEGLGLKWKRHGSYSTIVSVEPVVGGQVLGAPVVVTQYLANGTVKEHTSYGTLICDMFHFNRRDVTATIDGKVVEYAFCERG